VLSLWSLGYSLCFRLSVCLLAMLVYIICLKFNFIQREKTWLTSLVTIYLFHQSFVTRVPYR
jgi:hypothetical protein